jgi:hypothetical protein
VLKKFMYPPFGMRYLAPERRQKQKERIRTSCESKRRLTVACRKVTRRATVAWHKRNLIRKIMTQGNCGPRSTLTAARIMMTRRARVAWHREKFVRKDCTRAKDE